MDLRHCDGPECEKTSPLGHPQLDYWTTLEKPSRFDKTELHFHSQECLLNWAKENTRNV